MPLVVTKVRALPCSACDDGVAKLPGGAPYYMANPPTDIGARAFSYPCYAHMSRNPRYPGLPSVPTVRMTIDALQWNQLSEIEVE